MEKSKVIKKGKELKRIFEKAIETLDLKIFICGELEENINDPRYGMPRQIKTFRGKTLEEFKAFLKISEKELEEKIKKGELDADEIFLTWDLAYCGAFLDEFEIKCPKMLTKEEFEILDRFIYNKSKELQLNLARV